MDEPFGGNILYVDLTKGKVRKEELSDSLKKEFLGGWGIQYKLAYDLIKPGTDSLSPENPLIYGTGVLVGTSAPGSTKLFAVYKAPLNDAIAPAAGGLGLAHQLKYSGYDYLVITGRSEEPVYLKIFDDDVELNSANHLWGKGIQQTTDELWKEHGRDCTVQAIGQAGENLVRFSFSLINKASTIGKGGMGALMGSKDLKAIVAKGTKGIRVADKKKFRQLINPIVKSIQEWPQRERWSRQGSMYAWGSFPEITYPYKNWTELYPPGQANKLYGIEILEKVKRSNIACPTCPIGCKFNMETMDGEYKGLKAPMAHFGGVAVFWGMRFDLQDYSRGVKLEELANDYGLETVTTSAIIDYAVDLYERGIIGDEETKGLELMRNFETALTLVEQITKREGLGDILAEGWLSCIKRFGEEAEKYAFHIKGLDVLNDPRMIFNSECFEQIVNPRGGFHVVPALSPTMVPGRTPDKLMRHCSRVGVPEERMSSIFEPEFNMARFTKWIEDWYGVMNIVGICFRHPIAVNYNLDKVTELFSAATGVEITPSEFLRVGEKITNLQRMINVREGFSRKDDSYPAKWLEEPLRVGDMEFWWKDYYMTKQYTKEDVERLIDDYYDERGWDQNGIPTKSTLKELGLEETIKDV
ncbi:MAG: aldehyde ferredoxin oxidoreductase family protein [Candidatus Lokiarchaeia archaeon]